MTVIELYTLEDIGYIREDLGEGWVYQKTPDGFTITIDNQLGGVKFVIRNQKHLNAEDVIYVYRIYNDVVDTETFFQCSLESPSEDIDLETIHIGLHNHLQKVLGF